MSGIRSSHGGLADWAIAFCSRGKDHSRKPCETAKVSSAGRVGRGAGGTKENGIVRSGSGWWKSQVGVKDSVAVRAWPGIVCQWERYRGPGGTGRERKDLPSKRIPWQTGGMPSAGITWI